MPFEILFLFGLILLNGVFAMSEIALVTARRTPIKVAHLSAHPAEEITFYWMDPSAGSYEISDPVLLPGDGPFRLFSAGAYHTYVVEFTQPNATGSSGVTRTMRVSMRRSRVVVGSQATTWPRLMMAIWSQSSWASSR